MIMNFQCDTCFFQTNCAFYKKLAPFSEEAKVDSGVELEFKSCEKYLREDFRNNEDSEN